MYKKLQTATADGIYEFDRNNNQGEMNICVMGTFGTATVEVGFTHVKGSQEFYKIPSTSAFASDLMLDIKLGQGMKAAIKVTSADAATDLELFINGA